MFFTDAVTLQHVITVYNDMFDHIHCVMGAMAKRKIEWMEHLFFAVKSVLQKLSKQYDEVTPLSGMLLMSAHILEPLQKLWSFRKWDKGMAINPEDKTSYTTQ